MELERTGRTPQIWLPVLLVGLASGLPTLWLPLGRDQGTALYVADVLLRGGAPYHDAWEIRPPGIFYVYASAILIWGKSTLSLRLLDLLEQILTALLLCRLGCRTFGRAAGMWAGMLYAAVYFLGNDFWTLGNTDGSVALPSVLALLALLPKQRGRRILWDLLAGLLMAAAFLVRFTQGLIYLPALALIFASAARTRPYRLWPRVGRLTVLSVGFAAGVGLFLAHLALTGGLADFYYTLFVFAPKYAVLAYQGRLAEFLDSALRRHLDFLLRYAPITIPALLACAWIALHRRTANGLAAILWLIAALSAMEVMGKFYAYHWLPLFAPLALLAGLFVDSAAAMIRQGRRSLGLAGLALLAACLIQFVGGFGAEYALRVREALALSTGTLGRIEHLRRFDSIKRGGDFSATANYLCADYLRSHTAPDDKVFIWGFEPLIYCLSDRQPPTRFCSNHPIVAVWRRQDWYQELIRDLQRERPKYILLVTSDRMPWISGHTMDSLEVLKRKLPELRDFVALNYEVETTIENIMVCRLQQRCPPDMALLPTAQIRVGSNDPDRTWAREPGSIAVPEFCMDRYEYPNQPGVEPRNYVSWREADQLCRAQGKRLCSEDEWERACSGAAGRRYCYGDERVSGRCNWGDGQPDNAAPRRASGAFPECVSPEGVFDLNGNLSEWTSTPFDQEGYERMYILRGGTSWWSDWYGQDCSSRHRHPPDEADYADDGFRCCAAARGL